MKIVFAVGSLSGGGAERVVAEIATEMAEKGHEVSVMLVASMENTYGVSEKVKIINCAHNYKSYGFFQRTKDIRRKIKEINPNAFVSFTVAVNIYSVLSCIGLPTRLILAERNDPRYDPKSKLFRIARKVLYPFADYYVFQTEGEQQFFSKKIQNRSIVIPNPVNPNLPEVYQGERTKRFVAAVRLAPQKNLKMAIDAFKMVAEKHEEFIFEIFGHGPLEMELKQYVVENELQGKVVFQGNSKQLYQDIADAYGFVMSSDYEGISNSMLEAMALGIPTISTDYPSGGARENIVNGYNGILVPVGDTKRMAEAMELLIESPDLAKKISENSVSIREKLDVGKITGKWIDYLEK